MLAAVIDARPEPMALTATLGPLVRGVIEGLIGSAILVVRARTSEIDQIADAAGCRVLVAEEWREGFARAVNNVPGLGILVLDTGLLVGPDFWPLLGDTLPMIGQRPAATEPAIRAGIGSPLRLAGRFWNKATGQVDRDTALLLPPSRAREIAQAKADPYALRYGKELVRLSANVTRVELG